MKDVPNTEYITINKDGVFIGGKPATKYRGEDICWLLGLQKKFADIQRLNKNVAELHVLSSEICGEESAKPGNPSGKHGPNAWCRVKFENGNFCAWVFYNDYASSANCAHFCAGDCTQCVRENEDFRSAMLGAVIDKQNSRQKQNALTNALKDTDLSQFIGTHKIGAYEIIVRKSGQNTRG